MEKPKIKLNIKKTEKQKPDIRKFSREELEELFKKMGEKAFRAKQVHEWLWQKGAGSFSAMTNLSKALRAKLEEEFSLRPLTVDTEQFSQEDGTIKSGFRMHEGHLIEGVLIPTPERLTACVSSQAGCSLSCTFCATGYIDKKRNLEPGEIFDQVVLINRQAEEHFGRPLSNIVFMGMGEPLMNYRNVLAGIERITAPDGLNMSPKRITVSTAGIAKFIKMLGDDEVKFNLALSLHAADDKKRNEIMPINETNTLAALADALKYFYQKTRRKITFEYILFHKFNDSLKDAEKLYRFTRHVPSMVNIIEYNPIDQADFVKSEEDQIDRFAQYLVDRGVMTTVRRSRGRDIDAACGQLANKKG